MRVRGVILQHRATLMVHELSRKLQKLGIAARS